MHSYSVNSSERQRVAILLAMTSIVLAWGIHCVLKIKGVQLFDEFSWLIDAPSAMVVYGFLDRLFYKWLWKNKIFRNIGLIKTPNIDGVWNGWLSTSFKKRKIPVVVEIHQDWISMTIVLRTKTSTSYSLVASIDIEPVETRIVYTFRNEPNSTAVSSMHTHIGTAFFRLENEVILSGEYFSGRDRKNNGHIELKRVKV